MIENTSLLVKDFPNLVYVILGATHPELKRQFGESYRLSLQQRAEKLGIEFGFAGCHLPEVFNF